MNGSKRESGCSKLAGALLLTLLAAPMMAWAAAPTAKIVIEPMWPQKIADLKLPAADTTSINSGMPVVGAGTKVYLRATGTDPDKGAITGSSWTLGAIPAGSAATLTAGPTANLYTLKTDVVGDYTVNLIVTDAQGETSAAVSQVITAANYVGVGNVPGYATPDISKGQCASCHNGTVQPDVVSGWLQTGHASKFTRDLDGITGAKYRVSCLRCHTVGWNTQATNGGFDEAMAAKSWTIPDSMKAGNWAAVPTDLKQLANIQCENCHGPGGSHLGNAAKIAVSYEAAVCSQCHGAPPYHTKVTQWESTRHALATQYPSGTGRETCVKCHTARGYIEYVKAGSPGLTYRGTDTAFTPITCPACHDPHSVKNDKQLRKVTDVTLENGDVISEGGLGKMCMTCHHSRRDAATYVIDNFARTFGPHGNPQADMLAGKNAITYGREIPSSTHLNATEDACVTCHMAPTPVKGQPGNNKVGEHSYRVKWDGDTPDNPSDDVENVKACEPCHGALRNFDRYAAADYDGDGKIEGVQTEVKGMMTILAKALPPYNQDLIAVDSSFTQKQLNATYNYRFVLSDGSYGIHNTRYAVGLLRASYKNLTGKDIGSDTKIRRRLPPTANPRGLVTASLGKVVPLSFALNQNAPNPFNPETEIHYAVPEPVDVKLDIYNSLGQRVRTLVDASHAPGEYVVNWNGTDNSGAKVSAGTYFYIMQAGTFVERRKMLLLQ